MIIRLYLPNPSWNFEHFSQYALYTCWSSKCTFYYKQSHNDFSFNYWAYSILLTLVVTCPIHILVMSNTCFSKLLSNTCFSKLLNLFEFFFETIYTYSQSCLNLLACNIGKGEHVNCETHVLTLKRSHNLDKIC